MSENVIRIQPHKYIHVLDNNTNLQRLEIGPATFIRKEHEVLTKQPTPMISLHPREYCVIQDPVVMDKDGKPQITSFGEVKIQLGETQIRTAEQYTDPFPLYPGESVKSQPQKLQNVQQNNSMTFRAIRDFVESDGTQRRAGESWSRKGPFTYYPRIEEEPTGIVKATVIKPNTALKLKAERELSDVNGQKRTVGEEWLIRDQGAYLPQMYEKVLEIVQGKILTDKVCVHLRAKKSFIDNYKIERKAGEEWLITNKQTQVHILDVHEDLIEVKNNITLSSREYCIILNPRNEKEKSNNWGTKQLVKGEKTFFLQPGEELQDGRSKKVHVLGEDEALLLKAIDNYTDEENNKRSSGEQWLIQGPRDFIPSVSIQIIEKRKSIPLDENEGIYVRDIKTGEVRSISGQTYLLKAHEQLYQKELNQITEDLLSEALHGAVYVPPKSDAKGNLVYEKVAPSDYKRDKTKIVTFKAPHNTAVQLYDYKLHKNRVVFGPELVMLGPDEQFTLFSLSAGKPKKEGLIKSLALVLGPDFMTDIVDVETSDHCKLTLQLSYNWYFKFDKENPQDVAKLFSVKDFVGDTCKMIASRVRGAVSSVSFEEFHSNSSFKIREAVFGKDKTTNKIREELQFKTNLLCITSVDIQTQEISDPKTRASLDKSINIQLDINSQSKEAASRQKADKIDQEARGFLERQKLEDQASSEEAKIELLKQYAQTQLIKIKGESEALAQAQAEAERIEGEASVRQAELRAQALKIEKGAELDELEAQYKAENDHAKAVAELEIKKAREMADIEINKFTQIVKAIGKETLVSISKAGPEMKAKLLSGLGLKGYLVTDGKNPINLFNTANGMIGDVGK